MSEERSGASILVESLVKQGVEFVFGYPGGAAIEKLAATGRELWKVKLGEISRGVLFPKHRTDLIGCAVTTGVVWLPYCGAAPVPADWSFTTRAAPTPAAATVTRSASSSPPVASRFRRILADVI